MNLPQSVWVVIAGDEIVTKLSDLIDAGNFSEANHLKYNLSAMLDKMEKETKAAGGSIYISTWERIILKIPPSLAEFLPNFLEPYAELFNRKIAVGIGLDFLEAVQASRKSRLTGQIELFNYDAVNKAEFTVDDINELPPNLYDPDTPPPREQKKLQISVSMPSFEESVNMDAEMIASTAQSLGILPPEELQQQMQDMASQQMDEQQPQQAPKSLLEALNGGAVPGDKGQIQSKEDQITQNTADQNPSGQEQKEQPQDGESQKQDDKVNFTPDHMQKIAELLARIKDDLPNLMALAEKNPEAYKQTINLMNKLLKLGHSISETHKAECIKLTEMLNKAAKMVYPVGTIKGRRKKIIVNGKAVWRAVAAGQVLDDQGQAISVRSHNAQADGA